MMQPMGRQVGRQVCKQDDDQMMWKINTSLKMKIKNVDEHKT